MGTYYALHYTDIEDDLDGNRWENGGTYSHYMTARKQAREYSKKHYEVELICWKNGVPVWHEWYSQGEMFYRVDG